MSRKGSLWRGRGSTRGHSPSQRDRRARHPSRRCASAARPPSRPRPARDAATRTRTTSRHNELRLPRRMSPRCGTPVSRVASTCSRAGRDRPSSRSAHAALAITGSLPACVRRLARSIQCTASLMLHGPGSAIRHTWSVGEGRRALSSEVSNVAWSVPAVISTHEPAMTSPDRRLSSSATVARVSDLVMWARKLAKVGSGSSSLPAYCHYARKLRGSAIRTD